MPVIERVESKPAESCAKWVLFREILSGLGGVMCWHHASSENLLHTSLPNGSFSNAALVGWNWSCGAFHIKEIGQQYKSDLYFPPETQLLNIHQHTIGPIFSPSALNSVTQKKKKMLYLWVNVVERGEKRMSLSGRIERLWPAKPAVLPVFLLCSHFCTSFSTHRLCA